MISDLPPGVAPFLRDHVSGYEELEALLLLARSPGRLWSRQELAESLNVTTDTIDTALANLLANGNLVVGEPQQEPRAFRAAPANQEVRDRLAELQLAYQEQRLAIVQLMSAQAVARIRTSAARRLADAFRFERPKK